MAKAITIEAPGVQYPTGSTKAILICTALVCALLELIDMTVVNVSLSEICGSLGATTTEIAWVVTGYSIANVIIIPLSAMLSSLFGRKIYFTGSVIVFTSASLMCGLSSSLWVMVFWRFIQGLGGGGLLSTAQSIIFGCFPPNKAANASAIFGLGIILGPTFGPTLGGFITDNYSWHWVFFINVPIGATAAMLAWNYVTNLEGVKKPEKMDWWGIIFLIIGIGLLQYVLEEGGSKDWFESKEITLMAIISVTSLIAFVWRELRIDYAAVNLRLYKNYNLAFGNVLNLAVGTVITGSVFIFPLFAQISLGWTATQVGTFLIPGALCTAASMIVVARLIGLGINPKIIMVLGAIMMSSFLILISFASPGAGSDFFFWPFILRGIGAAFMMSPVIALSVAGLSGKDLAQGTALSNMLRQMGGAVGIALINIFLNTRTMQARTAILANITESNTYNTERFTAFKGLLLNAGYAIDDATRGAWQMLNGLVSKQQMVLAYDQGFFLMGFSILGCIPIILSLRRIKYEKKSNSIEH